MNLFNESRGRKIHTRTIEVDTYEHDEEMLLVEGTLKDRGHQEYYLETGERRESGIIHHIVIRFLMNVSSLVIEDIGVNMITVPREQCLETISSLESVKGMRIAAGFTVKMKELAGGIKGCSHLLALLTSMAPAAIQAYGVYQLRKPVDQGSPTENMFEFIIDTCRTWRKDGPLVKGYLDSGR